MELSVRLAASDDVLDIQAIVAAAYTIYVPRIGQKPGPMLDDYAKLIAERRVHVAERNDISLGVVVLIPEDDTFLLDNIAVRPSAQGTGVGRGLLDYAERVAIQAGLRTIRLYTNEAMVENLSIYSGFGYIVNQRGEESGFRRVYMSKTITRTDT